MCFLRRLKNMTMVTKEDFVMELPDDCFLYVGNFLPARKFSQLNKKLFQKWQIKRLQAVLKIQRWYRTYRLTSDDPYSSPYDEVTRKTLLRFYVTKYKKEWLQQFPNKAVSKLSYLNRSQELKDKYLNLSSQMNKAYIRTFYNFVNEYNITKNDLDYYGW